MFKTNCNLVNICATLEFLILILSESDEKLAFVLSVFMSSETALVTFPLTAYTLAESENSVYIIEAGSRVP